MAIVIGIAGFAGTGKDTLAQAVLNHLHSQGHLAVIRPFAHAIKQITQSLGIDPNNREKKEQVQVYRFEHFELALADALEDNLGDIVGADDLCELFAFFVTALRSEGYLDTNQVLTISPRRFQQLLGTEGGRAVRRTFWTDVFIKSLRHLPPSVVVLVPDVRFENELDACSYTVGINRPGVEPVIAHESEKAIPTLVARSEYKVHNTGSLSSLEAVGRDLAGVIAYKFCKDE